MNRFSDKDSFAQDVAYRRALVDGLRVEACGWVEEYPELSALAEEISAACKTLLSQVEAVDWKRSRQEYKLLCYRLGAELIRQRPIARAYSSMDEFWIDAESQACGASPHTFWDVYEHGGRRRIESLLASLYGAEDALLLNSGMSALAVALETANLQSGESVLLARSGYFETTDLVCRTLAPRGVEILAVEDVGALGGTETKIAILEVAGAAPGTPEQLDPLLKALTERNVRVVLDNSLYGLSVKWQDLLAGPAAPLVMESTAKYLCEYVSGGVLYGNKILVEQMRQVARTTGQQMQAAAFSYMRTGELKSVPLRMAIHERNVQILVEGLHGTGRLDLCASPTPNLRTDSRTGPTGSVLYLRVGAQAVQRHGSRQSAHRKLVGFWRTRAEDQGEAVQVRAGYGWDQTSIRCYEGTSLKQHGIDDYIRISVGIETAQSIRRLSDALSEAIEELVQ